MSGYPFGKEVERRKMKEKDILKAEKIRKES